MAETSHQDPTRRRVGITALGVCALRAIETGKGPGAALINDPFAAAMATEDGYGWIQQWREQHGAASDKEMTMIDGLAIRTKKIDQEIVKYINDSTDGIRQICVPGAGLDSRPWRIDSLFSESTLPSLCEVRWYELDFPEMFQHKLTTLGLKSSSATADAAAGSSASASTPVSPPARTRCAEYHPIEADLSLKHWDSLLTDASRHYDPAKRSLWLLEGFTSYLTEEELSTFFQKMSTLAAPGSILIATFITQEDSSIKIPYHKSMYPDPPAFVAPFGWETMEAKDLNTLVEENPEMYNNRMPPLRKVWQGYQIVVAKRV